MVPKVEILVPLAANSEAEKPGREVEAGLEETGKTETSAPLSTRNSLPERWSKRQSELGELEGAEEEEEG